MGFFGGEGERDSGGELDVVVGDDGGLTLHRFTPNTVEVFVTLIRHKQALGEAVRGVGSTPKEHLQRTTTTAH